jgi:hypothetical protein
MLLSILKTLFTFYITRYLNEEVKYTEPSPSFDVPWISTIYYFIEETGQPNQL